MSKNKTVNEETVIARINAIKKELNQGNDLYKKNYLATYEEWAANTNHKKPFNPDRYFILNAIKDRMYNLLKELGRLENNLPEG